MSPAPLLELRPGDWSDPTGIRAGSVFAAALDVERSASLRRRLLPRLALVALTVYLLAATTQLVPYSTFVVDLSMLAGIAAASLIVEMWKRGKLHSLMAASRTPARI
jgi:hypothetical protein